MNCKPGDLAWIVCTGPKTKSILGRMVRVLELDPHRNRVDDPAWKYEGPKLPADDGSFVVCVINDRCLKPHRPGDLHETTDERKEVTA